MKQTLSLLWMAVRSLPQRVGASSVIVVAVAAAVAIFAFLLTLSSSLNMAMRVTGRDDRAVVLRRGSDAEVRSLLGREALDALRSAPGVAASGGQTPLVSGEIVRVIDLQSRSAVASFPLRSVGKEGAAVRPEIKVVNGRMFESGAYEVIVGRAVQERVAHLKLGDSISMNATRWKIVGVFTAAGSVRESEVLTSTETLQAFYQTSSVSSATVLLNSEAAFEAFRAAAESNPVAAMQVVRESDYYRAQSQIATRLLRIVAYLIGVIASIAAALAVINAMQSAVRARARDLSILRAIGFESAPIAMATLAEAMGLALVGATLGALFVRLAFDGTSMSALTWGVGMSQTAFELRFSSNVLLQSICAALMVGFGGGFPAAWRAVSNRVANALRRA